MLLITSLYSLDVSWGPIPWKWKLVLSRKDAGILGSEGEEFNLGLETRLDHSELLCNKVLLKYKGDRESFWHRHQKGAERVPPCLQLDVICYYQAINYRKEMSQNSEWQHAPQPQCAFWDNIGTRWVIQGHKMIDMNLEERQVSKRIHSLINIA